MFFFIDVIEINSMYKLCFNLTKKGTKSWDLFHIVLTLQIR